MSKGKAKLSTPRHSSSQCLAGLRHALGLQRSTAAELPADDALRALEFQGNRAGTGAFKLQVERFCSALPAIVSEKITGSCLAAFFRNNDCSPSETYAFHLQFELNSRKFCKQDQTPPRYPVPRSRRTPLRKNISQTESETILLPKRQRPKRPVYV